MGSLSRDSRDKTCRIFLASFVLILSVGLLSPSVRAANDVEGRKLHRLETLGLDIQDPTIVQAADNAHALRSVDVFPKGDNINVVLQFSGVPSYNSYIYRNDNRRLVLDLYNTINIAPSSEFELGKDDPIRMVRNAQYRVEPSLISRVVLELDAGVTPEIKTEGNNLVITALATGLPEAESSVELPIEMLQPVTPPSETIAAEDEAVEIEPVEIAPERDADVPGETITVPGVEVETDAPEIEIVLARAVPESEPAFEETPVAMGSATKEVELSEIPLEIPEILETEEVPMLEIEEVPAADEAVETPAEPEPAMADIEEEANHIEELIEEIAEQPEVEEPSVEAPEFEEPEMEMIQDDSPAEETAAIEAVEPEPMMAVEVVEAIEPEPMMVVEVVEAIEPEPMMAAEVVEAVVEEIPEAEEIEQAPLEIEPIEEPAPIEEIEIEVEDIEVVEVEEVVVTMEEEAAAEILMLEALAAEPTPEEAVKMFGEMFSEMASAIQAEMAALESAGGIFGGEILGIDAPAGEPEVDVDISGGTSPGEALVTLNFRDAELSAVLDVLARKGALNIIAGKGVTGKVTVRLVDVPLDVALNAILNVNGFGYLKADNIIRILPLTEIGDVVNMSTETYRLSYAKATDAKKTLDSFLSPSGHIAVDSRTNMLLVTDIPGNKERLEKLINEIDRRVQQVLIEVIILDSVLLDDADLGISWGMLNTKDNSPNSKEAVRLDEENPFPDQFGITLPTGANALNVVFGTMFNDIDLNIFIDAMVSDTNSKVLANPKILTLNNETATIEIIQEFPYNDVTQTSSGGQLSNITFKEIGTKLQVRPQITHDDHVILWIAPEQNSIAGTTAIGVPIVDTRRAETTLIVRNHQTIVMGGLRENRSVNTLNKVPFFGDLPGVKYAFRSVQSAKQDTELLVFLTVHIMESSVLLPEERIKAEELANLPRNPNATIELIR